MRHVVKKAEPQALRDWKSSNQQSPQNLNYSNLPSDVRNQVRAALLNEQGHLCAYTLRRIRSITDCHIEHIRPQNTNPELDLDYANMAACFPKDGGDKSSGYGAPIKGGQGISLNENFISPHEASTNNRFLYNSKGEVSASDHDVAALGTINILQLCHKQLVELRRTAIEAHGLTIQRSTTRKSKKLKSAAEARRFAREVLQPDSNGQLEPFCVVLAQVALKYADNEEARARRIRSQ
ncbi:retron system putative HNH endonuclease [Chitinimonas taiwanensis]|uniref:TIGR02646 family protein n=1 Tax=Chitinimonas taiwanensis DSM 18899 TaxID=1121279 RepID=A0A1K2HN68_9NEIS|nr:retron system putative HNH endonuclease [Chitinimonas taiwanensis]SFZ78009.1 TIGR02646 family protein [Chitinimonas taiwanensis DSM 18899]